MSASNDKTLRALAKEIKIPLTAIAREAELHNIDGISRKASGVMTLLDGYLLAAQTEYGQANLPIETTGLGSIIYDVAQDIKSDASERHVVVSSIADSNTAVMTHARGLRVALDCLAQLALEAENDDKAPKKNELKLISYEKRSGKSIAGVFSNKLSVTQGDVERAKRLYGDSHIALSTQLKGSGIRLAIAQHLADSLGARLLALRKYGMHGIGFELIKSEQLRLV